MRKISPNCKSLKLNLELIKEVKKLSKDSSEQRQLWDDILKELKKNNEVKKLSKRQKFGFWLIVAVLPMPFLYIWELSGFKDAMESVFVSGVLLFVSLAVSFASGQYLKLK